MKKKYNIYFFFLLKKQKKVKINKEKMYLINKIFQNEKIRTVWDKEKEKYYISVVDIVGVISESDNARKYWNKLKQRLKEEGNETVTKCHQLKLKAKDGKYRMTDVCDIEKNLGESIVTKNNLLNYQYQDDAKQLDK